jgi:hypothetical protein
MSGSGNSSSNGGDDRARRAAESKRIVAAAKKATVEAVRMHKRLGNPIAVWRDGKVVILPPEEIPDPADEG